MDIVGLIEKLLRKGLDDARRELSEAGITVSDDALSLAMRVVTSLWRSDVIVNANTLRVDDQRSPPPKTADAG